jgi:nickel-dependent lactate racemase
MNYPQMSKIKQKFPTEKLEDITREIDNQFNLIDLNKKIMPGGRYAVTAGSRGISNLNLIIKSVCDYIKNCGATPFIVPSMGSHGGATGDGQAELLTHFGITEEKMGAEIISSMEVVTLGTTSNGAPVYMDKNAYESDGIIVVNRVKPHTDFTGDNESGIVKMVAVGLGKRKRARPQCIF